MTTAGGVKCWGDDTSSQLGDGRLIINSVPVDMPTTGLYTSYIYDSIHKHAVASLNFGNTYTYDANGNMVVRVEGPYTYTQIFDAENRLVSVTVNSQTTQFIYDDDGNLVKMITPGGSYTIYIGSIYEVSKNAGGVVTDTTTYYPAGGAMRVNGTLFYTLKDQLGSVNEVLDVHGNINGEIRYYPYGETRVSTGSLFTNKLYTGQQQIIGLGLYNYKARFYEPSLGRFIQPDTETSEGSIGFNRYSYVNNFINIQRLLDARYRFSQLENRYSPPDWCLLDDIQDSLVPITNI